MKRDDLKQAFDRIEPGRDAEKRMLDHILNQSKDAGSRASVRSFNPKRAIPVLAMTLVVAAGVMVWSLSLKSPMNGNPDDGRLIADDSMGSAPREDAVAVLKDQFQLGNRHYILLQDQQRAEYGLPEAVKEENIGDKLATITTSVDKSLEGLEVYRYTPAGGEAIVAVKKETGWQLFRFYAFESYMNNQDEDARDYLELYGIYSAEDIARILFIGYSERAKLEGGMEILAEISDGQRIGEFYQYYSVIPNSSDSYFEKLFGYTGSGRGGYTDAVPDPAMPGSDDKSVPPIPPDYMDGVTNDMPAAPDYSSRVPVPASEPAAWYGTTPAEYAEDMTEQVPAGSGEQTGHQGQTSASSAGRPGTNALDNPITIRIYNRSGIYLETVYYPNIGFISRHAVNDAFAAFLRGCMAD